MGRTLSRYLHFKYKLVKKLRNRALSFKENAETKEQEEAWDEVVAWFNSFIDPKYRGKTKFGAIAADVPDPQTFSKLRSRNDVEP
jgi:hypothetical protein